MLAILASSFCFLLFLTVEAKVVVDMTHPLGEDTNCHPLAPVRFKLTVHTNETQPAGYWLHYDSIETMNHCGTHMDAPSHFGKGKWTIEQIPYDRLLDVEAIIVDIRQHSALNPDYLVTIGDLMNWEKEHGRIPNFSVLLLRTGWSNYWSDPAKYHGNEDLTSQDLHYPGLSPNASKWLITERFIIGTGSDAFSIDNGPSKDFQSHTILSNENTFILENLKMPTFLPQTGIRLFINPLPIRTGSGSLIRIYAVLEDGQKGTKYFS